MNGFHHVAMRVFDFDKVIAFYTEGLGLEKGISWGENDKRAAMIHVGEGNCLEIFAGGKEIRTENEEGAIVHIAFASKCCDKDLERARNAGAVVTMEPQDIELQSNPKKNVRIAFCKGFGGELLEFFEEK